MNTPPKAPCHSCNGTGIDPTVGFLDCEFCTPAFAGVSLSAPEQPEPTCTTCNEHGEIGCLRPDGYDGERYPDCNPATVKRYHVTEAGLVEGHALGRLNVVLGADHDRVTAERDALQQRLTAADERADVLEGLVRDAQKAFNYDPAGSCYNPGIAFVKPWSIRAIAALKPAEGGGDHVKHYECIGKGGDYTVVAIAKGAGMLKGFNHYVYKNADGVHFVRDPEDFLARMQVKP